ERYFAHHPDYELGASGRRTFLTSGAPGPQSDRVSQFWGAPLTFDPA
ncbi:MAG: glutamate racemase, partial [Brevundimonas sp.]|nr:glutamate racemase [Brevundimonas sp.]